MAARAPLDIEAVRARLRDKGKGDEALEPAYPACAHTMTEKRRRRIADGRIQVFNQCLTCGAPGPNVSQQGLNLDSLPWYDDEAQELYWAEQRDVNREHYRQREERRRARWFDAYNDYLETPEWKELRELVILEARGICQGCRRKRATDAHHISYEHVGNEFLWELKAVCRGCHERWHDRPLGGAR